MYRAELVPGDRQTPIEPATIVYEHTVWRYVLALPAMAVLAWYVRIKKAAYAKAGKRPRTNVSLFDGLSINGRRTKEGAARWPALNTCYNFRKGEGRTSVARAIDAWWMNMRNAQAVRNRLALAKCELRRVIQASLKPGKAVRILSLAAGSAQGVIEVAAECEAKGIATQIMLVDQDPSALEYARDIANRYGVEIKAVEGNVLFFTRAIGVFQADIIEMIGLIDYLKDGLAIALIKKVRRHLEAGGYFLTCHIHPNAEAYFLKQVIDWDMLYRTRDQLQRLITAGGFAAPRLASEPHGIHTIAVAEVAPPVATKLAAIG